MAQTWLYWGIPIIIVVVILIISLLVYRFWWKEKKTAEALRDAQDELDQMIADNNDGFGYGFSGCGTVFNPLATGPFGNEIYQRQMQVLLAEKHVSGGTVKGYPEIILPSKNVNELNKSCGFTHLLKDELLTYGYIKYYKLNKQNIEIKNLTAIIINYLSINLPKYLKELHYAFNNPSDETLKIYDFEDKSNIDRMDCQLFNVLIKHSTKPPKGSVSKNDIQIISYILKKYAHHKIRDNAKDINYMFLDNEFNFNYIVFNTEESASSGYPNYISTEYSKRSLTQIGTNISTLSYLPPSSPIWSLAGSYEPMKYFDYLKNTVLLKLNEKIGKSVGGVYHGKYKKNSTSMHGSHDTNYEYIVISLNGENNRKHNRNGFKFDQYIVWSGVVGWSNVSFRSDYHNKYH